MASFYGRPSQRWVQEGDAWPPLWTSGGWAQGDPGAPIAYAAGVDGPAKAAQATLRRRAEEHFGPAVAARVRVLSYLDDFVILAPPAMAEEAVLTTAEALRPTGYIP